MTLPWPRTLFARLMLIWLVGMALVIAVSLALIRGERDRFDRDVLHEGIAREIVAAVDVLDRLPAQDREEWIEALGRRRLRFVLRLPPPEARPLPQGAGLVKVLERTLPEREVAVVGQVRGRGEFGHHVQSFASLRLADGTPLTVRLPAPMMAAPPPPPPGRMLAALLALAGGVALLTWIAVRIATRPLSRLAAAADALGEDPNRVPMDTRGPAEVTRAARAFNRMQGRIQQHVGERTRILAAISHDLQTPITRLRLRAEMIEDEALRTKIQADLDAMQALAREGLDYARSLDASAPVQSIDLNGLAEALVADAQDMGWQLTLSGRADAPCHGQLSALRRALWNLVENGVKFGERVDITLDQTPTAFRIRVRDHGPGLPEDEREKVFEPFYRTEASRNRETGGTGLGLAIARNLLHAQGGKVVLANHPDGGLEALVTLPRAGRSPG